MSWPLSNMSELVTCKSSIQTGHKESVEKSHAHLFLESFRLNRIHFPVLSRQQEMLPRYLSAFLESSFWKAFLESSPGGLLSRIEWKWISSSASCGFPSTLPGAGMLPAAGTTLWSWCCSRYWGTLRPSCWLTDLHQWAADSPATCSPFSLLGRRGGQARGALWAAQGSNTVFIAEEEESLRTAMHPKLQLLQVTRYCYWPGTVWAEPSVGSSQLISQMSSPTSSTPRWVRHWSTPHHHPAPQGMPSLLLHWPSSWWRTSSTYTCTTLSPPPPTDPSSSNLFIKFVDDTTVVGLISNRNETGFRRRRSSLWTWTRQRRVLWTAGDRKLSRLLSASTVLLWRGWAAPGSWGCTSLRTSPGPAAPLHWPKKLSSVSISSGSGEKPEPQPQHPSHSTRPSSRPHHVLVPQRNHREHPDQMESVGQDLQPPPPPPQDALPDMCLSVYDVR